MPARRTSRKTARTGPVRASIYVRMSLDKTGEALGVDRQEKACRAKCAELGMDVREVYVDNDVSATTGRKRPAFEALLASSPEAIVVWHTDRLVRLSRELQRVIDLDVNVYTVEAGDLNLSTPAGRAVARTITAWAEYEGEQKGLRQQLASRQRAEHGRAWWSSRPFGFEMDGTHRAEEATALARVYGDLLTGASLPSLARQLNDAGHTTCRGGAWTATTLRPVLLNARNAGIRVYDGEEVGAAAWNGIVSEDTYRAAVRHLTNPERRTGGGGAAPRNLLTGVATCGKCGGPVKVGRRGGRAGQEGAYAVYVCRTSSCVSTPVVEADAAVTTFLARELDNPRSREEWQTLRRQGDEASRELRVEESTLQSRLDGIAEDYADGAMDRAQFRAATDRLRARLTKVEEELARVNAASDLAGTVTPDSAVVMSFLAMDPTTPDPENAPMSVDELRTLIAAVYERVELLPRGRGVRHFLPQHLRLTPRHASGLASVEA
ncbi:recombinase family protein [Geodermatophilus sp. SYSU D00710]